jgi:hypothetical protein
MQLTLDDHKRFFSVTLWPYFEMLLSKQSDHPLEAWLTMIDQTRARIISNPQQYLGNELPSLDVTTQLITKVFEDFIVKSVPENELLAIS